MKKPFSILTALCMSLSVLAANVYAKETADYTASEWAAEDITRARELNIIDSFLESDDYTLPINREEFCEMTFNLMGLISDHLSSDVDSVKFTDVDNGKVIFLAGMGIINGKSETEFAPDDTLTREEAAAIIIRMINAVKPMPATEMWFEFADADEISDWAMSSIQTICNLGFMQGVGDNRFDPQNTYTKEQSAAVLLRVYDAAKLIDEQTPPEEPQEYTYETPLGTVTTASDGESFINFGVETEAVVQVFGNVDGEFTQRYIDIPVDALTNQDTSQLISFDSFAEIFGGEWSLENNTFVFNYDPDIEITLSETHSMAEDAEKPRPSGDAKIEGVVYFEEMESIIVNGEEVALRSQSSGETYNGAVMMYNGKLYIPSQMVAELLVKDFGSVLDKACLTL